jgi:transposase
VMCRPPGARWAYPVLTDTVTVVVRPRRGVEMATFPKEFKDQLVELHLKRGRSFMDLAREYNVSATSIANWVRDAEKREAREVAATGGESDQQRIARLEKELARKNEELDILGKALAYFARQADQ